MESAAERLAASQEKSKPVFDDMHEWLKRERATLSKSSEVIEPIDYMLKRWDGFARSLEDGRICLTNNAAERALRGIALGRRNWTFAGSRSGADRSRHHAIRHHDLPSQRRGPKGVACRCVRPRRRSSRLPPARTAALAMEGTQRGGYCGGRGPPIMPFL